MHIELEQRQDLCILRLHGRFLTGSNADYADVRTRLGVAACRNVVVEYRAPQQKQCPSNRDAVRSPRLLGWAHIRGRASVLGGCDAAFVRPLMRP